MVGELLGGAWIEQGTIGGGLLQQAAGIPVVLICDNDYVMPTCVAVTSLVANKALGTKYEINIISTGLSTHNEATLLGMGSDTVTINVLNASTVKYAGLHKTEGGSFCVASTAALLKFELPLLMPEHDRILYLDGDVIVRGDLTELFQSDIGENLAGAVADSGQIYFKHAFVQRVERYFNSGVMILNLKLMRELNMTEVLTQAKKDLGDSSLMDQNVFNVVFSGRVTYLPITYNFLYINLMRASGKYTISDINELYGTQYVSLDEIESNAKIVHFSSKDKPWKYSDVPLADEWFGHYEKSPFGLQNLVRDVARPKVSVVIPIYNVETYLAKCLESVLGQTLESIEIICVDDGSTDRSPAVLEAYRRRDRRITTLVQENAGQSTARNKGMAIARGEYVYFLDADDYIDCDALELLYLESVENSLDVLYFDAVAFFETQALEDQHRSYASYYLSTGEYTGVSDGPRLFAELVPNGDYRPSPCTQFIRTEYLKRINLNFYDGIIHEDNLFSLLCILQAERAKHIKRTFFHRRVRAESTMTARVGLRNFLGYFVCMVEMLRFVDEAKLTGDVADSAFRQIAGMHRRAAETLSGLPHSEKIKIVWPVGSMEDIFFRFMHTNDVVIGRQRGELKQAKAALRECERKLAKSKKRLKEVKASRAYKVGRAMMYLPHKVAAGVRRIRE